jgi:rhamnosyltransferase subunit B
MRILLAPFGSHGDVHPFIGLGLALKARGHDVHIITSGAFRDLVERHGFEFAPVGTAEEFEDFARDPDLWHPRRSVRAILGRPEKMAPMLREGYRHIAERYRPGETVLVGGILAFWARIAHDKPGIPFATVHIQPSVIPSVIDPPEFASLRMRSWWPHWFRSFLFWVGDRWVVDPMLAPPVNDFRRELGLPPVQFLLGRWVHSPQRVIGLFPEWYGHAADWPPQFRHAGFIRYDQAECPMPHEVEAFLHGGEPPIIFTFGSAMRQGAPYFAAAVEACRILGRRGLLLAKGRDQIPADLPASVLHAEYAPFSQVFPRAAAVVHHGGIGTTAQGLAAGVPQLVMPLAFDQPDNARRLERLGVGARLWPNQFTGSTAAAAIRALLERPGIASHCREVAQWMAKGNPAATACDFIEALVGQEPR